MGRFAAMRLAPDSFNVRLNEKKMRAALFVLLLFIGLWVLLGAYLTNALPIADYLPRFITNLTLPKSTAGLGDSLAILDGIFSSIAIALGLVAIIFQGKELKESVKAQAEQANILSLQMRQQEQSNKLAAYTARLQFLLGEMDRLGADIERLVETVGKMPDGEAKKEKKQILDNTIRRTVQGRWPSPFRSGCRWWHWPWPRAGCRRTASFFCPRRRAGWHSRPGHC